MSLASALRRRLRAFRRAEDGNPTVEFVIIFPVFMSFLFMGIESGLMLTRQIMLERAVDIAVRDLRIGTWTNPTHEDLKQRICENGIVLKNCDRHLVMELRRVSMETWDFPGQPPACVDRREEIAPVTTLTTGGGNDMMLLRACMVVDPLFPTTRWGLQLPLDASGGFQLFAFSAFVNEPR